MKIPSPVRIARRLRRVVEAEALARYRRMPVVTDQVLYEAFAGSGVLDNPEAIFAELLEAPDLANLHHVWVLDRAARRSGAAGRILPDPRVRVVTRGSLAYRRAVSTSGWLINNATFPHWFSKRPGQTYLNTWHGTPLKRMGYDMPDGAREAGGQAVVFDETVRPSRRTRLAMHTYPAGLAGLRDVGLKTPWTSSTTWYDRAYSVPQAFELGRFRGVRTAWLIEYSDSTAPDPGPQ